MAMAIHVYLAQTYMYIVYREGCVMYNVNSARKHANILSEACVLCVAASIQWLLVKSAVWLTMAKSSVIIIFS